MKNTNKEGQKNAQKENLDFKVGDLIKIKDQVHFVEEEFLGAPGLIVSLSETGYPKGVSGRQNDGKMYTVASCGKKIRLFEEEMEKV